MVNYIELYINQNIKIKYVFVVIYKYNNKWHIFNVNNVIQLCVFFVIIIIVHVMNVIIVIIVIIDKSKIS